MEKFIDVFGLKNCKKLPDDELYVMLMLQRSEEGTSKVDCEDAAIAVACALDSDKCPAECKEDSNKDSEKEDTVVKSGDLAVSAKAADGRKALIGGVSDLDTITFKTSEDVTISSITLERYGYSTIDDVESVQLEDEDGNIIADAKTLNNKGQVKLTLKKDYKTVDGTYKATVVVKTRKLGVANTEYADKTNGSTLGFKVVAAESTAKNLNLDDYSPYTYDLVNYDGSAVQFSSRNSATKDYNWEAGKLYEVAKFRVKAPSDANILVKGFTLTDNEGNKIDADKYAKDVKVTFNGKEVDGLKWNINKNDELVISFDEVEVAGKETATIAVSMSFTEEFDKFNQPVVYYIKQLSNFNATDKKTGTRVSEAEGYTVAILAAKLAQANGWTQYTFKGGKIKLSGTKLGTVNAAAGSTNVLVAQGEINITEALRGSARIAVKNDNIDEIRLVINGEEYEGTKEYSLNQVYKFTSSTYNTHGTVSIDSIDYANNYTLVTVLTNKDANDADVALAQSQFCVRTVELPTTAVDLYEADCSTDTTIDIDTITKLSTAEADNLDNSNRFTVYKFTGLEIEKSGKVEVRVDLKDGDNAKGTMEFVSSFNSDSFVELKYDESGDNSAKSQVTGSITLSNVKTQAAKASLENSSTKEVELIKGENNRKPIFEGTYTAKKGEITLKNFEILATANLAITPDPTFYVTIDNEEMDAKWTAGSCKDENGNLVACAKGDIDDIKVEAGKSVNVKVEIEITPTSAKDTSNTFNIKLSGEDVDNNIAGEANEDTVKVRVVEQGTLETSDTSAKNTVLLKSNREVAKFTIKPSKSGDDDIVLKTMEFTWSDTIDNTTLGTAAWDELKFDIDGDDYTTANGTLSPDVKVPAEGLVVKVTLKSELDDTNEATWKRSLVLSKVNGNTNAKTTFNKYWVKALLENITQKKEGDNTNYTLDVNNDTSNSVSYLKFYIDGTAKCGSAAKTMDATTHELDDTTNCVVKAEKSSLSSTNNTFSAVNGDSAHSITAISYYVGDTPVVIFKSEFEDFFKAGSNDLMVYSNK